MWLITYKQEKSIINKIQLTIETIVEEITSVTNENPIQFWLGIINENYTKQNPNIKYNITIIYSFKFDRDKLTDKEFELLGIDQIITIKHTVDKINE